MNRNRPEIEHSLKITFREIVRWYAIHDKGKWGINLLGA